MHAAPFPSVMVIYSKGGGEMKIGLIDVDYGKGKFPNLAQMKISSYHKRKKDTVEPWNGLLHYDIVYKSKVFTDDYAEDNNYAINADLIIKGGTGYDLDNKLPEIIEHQTPDYRLYPNLTKDKAFGYLTRGCPRNCGFCIVSKKEGCKSEMASELREFWNGQLEIKLLDPNITAAKECEKLFVELVKSRAKVDFTQGLDIRLMTDTRIDLINRINMDTLHFAWDDINDIATYNNLKKFRTKLKTRRHLPCVYVLTNYNSTFDEDLERVYKLRELDYNPYVMIYNKPSACSKIKLLQGWTNNRKIFLKCERFEDYNPRME